MTHRQRRQIIRALEDMIPYMACAAMLMQGVSDETVRQHSDELAGAVRMAKMWIAGLVEEAKNS